MEQKEEMVETQAVEQTAEPAIEPAIDLKEVLADSPEEKRRTAELEYYRKIPRGQKRQMPTVG